jgi:hypothetical protein
VKSITTESIHLPPYINVLKGNNELTWKDIDENYYTIYIKESFFHSVESFMFEIANKFNEIPVKNTTSFFFMDFVVNNEVFIDTSFFSKSIFYKPLKKENIDYEYNEFVREKITLYYPNHNMIDGDIIYIENAISFLGIPDTIINNKHTIYIKDNNNIYFYLKNYNIQRDTVNEDNGGGANVIVKRHVSISFTESRITNMIQIKGDNFYSTFKNPFPICLYPNFFYIKLVINNGDVCSNIYTIKGKANILSKVNIVIQDNNNYSLKPYHFTHNTLIFDPPISTLYSISVQFYNEKNEIIDFFTIDHDIVLKIEYF